MGESTQSVAPPHSLTRRHFILQDELPAELVNFNLGEVDPLLRCLLFTDGTVTRTLEVQGLAPVAVEVVSQARVSTAGEVAARLSVAEGTESVRRRVVISGGAAPVPVIWAESHIVPTHLPPHFLTVLDGAAEGIGQSLQQSKLESWRDMLWCGLGVLPDWCDATAAESPLAITRLYRVITGGRPALLISESFGVTRDADAYHLRLGMN